MDKYNLKKSDEFVTELKKTLPRGTHYNFNFPWEGDPILFSRGKGTRLWDVDGNEYLDFYSRFGADILGHNNEEYIFALEKAVRTLITVDHTELNIIVCDLLKKHIPNAEMVRFGLSGTEIVQNAIRLARAYTGKNKFLRFEGHFHGSMDNILGGKVSDYAHPVPKECPGDERGTRGRAKDTLESQSYMIPWNDEDILEQTIIKYGDDIAAMIMEPICVNGGGIMPKAGYLKKVRKLCDEHNIVLIFDEIITGFRFGLGGVQKKLGVIPDLATFGKAITGGAVPVSVLTGKREIMKLYEEKKVTHAGTFNGYPLGLEAIRASIHILSKDNGASYKKMDAYARQMQDILKREAVKNGISLVTQLSGAAFYYHCTDTELESVSDWSTEIKTKDSIVRDALLRHGIIISPVSRFYLNVSMTDADMDFFTERVSYAMQEVKQMN